jgi:hypothetical protein
MLKRTTENCIGRIKEFAQFLGRHFIGRRSVAEKNSADLQTNPKVEKLIIAQEERAVTYRPNAAQAIVFSTLLFLGAALFWFVTAGKADWFYPTLAYFVAVYFAWQKFF